MNRRAFLQSSAALAAASLLTGAFGQSPTAAGCTLSIGTYSTKGVPLDQAIKLIADTGYDGVELCVHPGFGASPDELSADRRRELRRLIEQSRLALPALMENLAIQSDDEKHRADLERLRRVMQLSHDLSPSRPPLIQTVLGGGKWEEKKNLCRDRLATWAELAKSTGIPIAIKPHRGGAMSCPADAIWLFEQLGKTPWLRMVYDYSHYAFRDLPLEQTIQASLPYTSHIAVKDAVQRDGKVSFALAGEGGTIDYARLLRLFYDGGYRGDVCVEVSAQIFNKPGYDPAAAARTCYQNMARAFEKSGVPRRRA